MKFVEFYEAAVSLLDTYYQGLDAYLHKQRGWNLQRISGDTQDGLVSAGYYQIIDATGDTLGKDAIIGKIKRKYSPKTQTLELEHISAALDSTGRKRVQGLRIVDTVYSFDREFVLTHDIKQVCIDAVSTVTRAKFQHTYIAPDFSITKQGPKLYAHKKA